jgi:hypothetical protein
VFLVAEREGERKEGRREQAVLFHVVVNCSDHIATQAEKCNVSMDSDGIVMTRENQSN